MSLFTKQERQTIINWLVPINETESLKRSHPDAWHSPDARMLRDMHNGDLRERRRLQRLTDLELQAALRAEYEQRQRIATEKAKGAALTAEENAEIERLVTLGKRFTAGRKLGTKGLIRKTIARLLTKTPRMKNADLWEAIANKPPKGWSAYDNSQGKYLEGPENENMGYKRFCNVASEERKNLTG